MSIPYSAIVVNVALWLVLACKIIAGVQVPYESPTEVQLLKYLVAVESISNANCIKLGVSLVR